MAGYNLLFTHYISMLTRKRGNECTATWGRPSDASPIPL